MSGEAIKNALEDVTPDRLRYEADAMFAAVQGEQYGDTFHAYNWADKPHRVLYGAIDLMRNSASTLESLQRENEELRKDKDHISAEKAGIAKNAHNNVEYWKSQAEAAEAEVKRLRDRYERWMPVTETPPAGMHPDALLHFYCISDEVDGDESPEYWKTDTWQDKPADAVYWCAIVSPLGPHETTFIARTALASTGGEYHGN